MPPFVSICIPAYKNVVYLERLLNSIKNQVFVDYEVIVTDDSPDNTVEKFISNFELLQTIHYYKNKMPLGTPENWNEAMRHATGKWIILVHDDDWFTTPDSLMKFTRITASGYDCIFSGYYTFNESNSTKSDKTITSVQFKKIKDHPYYLFGNNIIGPPSVLFFKKESNVSYDQQLKWLVDIDAFVTILKENTCTYLPAPLITMSSNDSQVTKECFQNPDIEIREALIYYKKKGKIVYRKLMAYDAWWRMLRNLNIRTKTDLTYYAKGETIPAFLIKILEFQKRIPVSLLNNGFISKNLMAISYVLNKISL